MKRKDFFSLTVIALLAVCMLTFGGCKGEEENEVEAGLVGNWSNEETGDDLKTFTIALNGSFTASLNAGEGAGVGLVDGVLIKDGKNYIMNRMIETTGAGWGSQVAQFNGTLVQITLSNNDDVFELDCADSSLVQEFFGGTYYRQ